MLLISTAAQAGSRYYVNTMWYSQQKENGPDYMRRYIDRTRELGFNGFSTDAGWGLLREDGTYDWTAFDQMTEYALSKGLDVFIRVNTSTYSRPYWFADEHLACDKAGKLFIDPRTKAGIPSISHPQVLRRAAEFYKALAAHCREKFGSGKIVCFSAAFTLYMESEYWEPIDYSPAAKSDFLIWAKKEYRTISSVNAKWGTKYESWEQVDLLTSHPTARELFFEYTLKRFFDTVSKALKQGDPKAKFGMQTGCIWDQWWRRTSNCAGLLENCDWLFVADAPTYPHRWTCDYLRGVGQGKVRVSNEIDGPYLESLTGERILQQGTETWEQGVDTLFVCNWSLESLSEPRASSLAALGKMAHEKPFELKADRAIYLSAWDIIQYEGHGAYEAFYNSLPDKDKRQVDIIHDSVFGRHPEVLKRYKEIYLPKNRRIPEPCRQALLTVKDRLRISDPAAAGTMDEYNNPTKPLADSVPIPLRESSGL